MFLERCHRAERARLIFLSERTKRTHGANARSERKKGALPKFRSNSALQRRVCFRHSTRDSPLLLYGWVLVGTAAALKRKAPTKDDTFSSLRKHLTSVIQSPSNTKQSIYTIQALYVKELLLQRKENSIVSRNLLIWTVNLDINAWNGCR